MTFARAESILFYAALIVGVSVWSWRRALRRAKHDPAVDGYWPQWVTVERVVSVLFWGSLVVWQFSVCNR